MSQRWETNDKTNTRDALDYYEATVLNPTYESAKYSGTGETDIIYQKGNIVGEDDGTTWCDDAVTWEVCDQHYVRFQSGQTPTDGLACHETGHAVGLTHGYDASPRLSMTDPVLGCMKKPVGSSDNLTNNLKSQIKGAYG